jgi:O-methyltransferase
LTSSVVSGSRRAAAAVVAAYDFTSFTRLVDVGGGNGILLAAAPQLRGVLFDRPDAVTAASDPSCPRSSTG